MVKLDSLKTDLDLASDGKWFDWEGDARLKIRSADCEDVQAAIQKSGIAARAAFSKVSESDRRGIKRIYASKVLVGWENIQDSSGADIPFSAALAFQFFEMKELAHLYEFVVSKATNRAEFRGGSEAEDEFFDEEPSPAEQLGNSSSS